MQRFAKQHKISVKPSLNVRFNEGKLLWESGYGLVVEGNPNGYRDLTGRVGRGGLMKISATSHLTCVAPSSSPVPKTFGIWPWRPDGSGLPPGKQNAKSPFAPAAESPNAQQNQLSHHPPRYLLNSQGFHQPRGGVWEEPSELQDTNSIRVEAGIEHPLPTKSNSSSPGKSFGPSRRAQLWLPPPWDNGCGLLLRQISFFIDVKDYMFTI